MRVAFHDFDDSFSNNHQSRQPSPGKAMCQIKSGVLHLMASKSKFSTVSTICFLGAMLKKVKPGRPLSAYILSFF